MSSQLESLQAQALQLSLEERAQVADRLITSLLEDHDIEAAWEAEVERRVAEIESGRSSDDPRRRGHCTRALLKNKKVLNFLRKRGFNL